MKNKQLAESFCLDDSHQKEIEKYEQKYNKIQGYEFMIKKKAKEVEYYLSKKKKRPELSQKETEGLLQRASALYKYDPCNASLLKVLVSWDICRDKKMTVNVFEEAIQKTPNNINIYIEYWKFLKYLKKTDRMIELSERMIKAADNPAVPTDQWIEAHDIRFKSLLMKGDSQEIVEEAVH